MQSKSRTSFRVDRDQDRGGREVSVPLCTGIETLATWQEISDPDSTPRLETHGLSNDASEQTAEHAAHQPETQAKTLFHNFQDAFTCTSIWCPVAQSCGTGDSECVSCDDEVGPHDVHPVCSCEVRSRRGRISRTRTTETTAAAAKTLKMTLSGTSRSRRTPKPQSARPPQLMLTRFMMPYPVARSSGRTIWRQDRHVVAVEEAPAEAEQDQEQRRPPPACRRCRRRRSPGRSAIMPMALTKMRPRSCDASSGRPSHPPSDRPDDGRDLPVQRRRRRRPSPGRCRTPA